MNTFEDQLDEIRVHLYEETKAMDTEEIIRTVNAHAHKIARELGITVYSPVNENVFQRVHA